MFSLKKWRIIKDITQQQMADFLGIHVNTYRIWEENPLDISLGNMYKILSILELKMDDIIFLPNESTKVS